MTDTKRLDVTDIDFESIRSNLKEYMRSQETLQDYDFEGSAITSIIDLLAYATHYNAVNANVGLNETFLESAQFRGSVVGHARMLGYTPRSAASPAASIDITVNNAQDGELIRIPRGHRFRSKIDNTTYTFVTTEEYTSTNRTFSNVSIFQSEFKTAEYVFDIRSSERYVIPDENVDASTIRVTVFDSRNSSTSTVFTPVKSITDIDETSRVYFLYENPDGLYEISFGDNSVGVSPENGNIIQIEYGITQQESANGAQIFSMVDSISGYSDVALTTIQRARGGKGRESIESIKRNAPITFASQNRGVTASDYEAIVRENFNNVLSVKAWGGEDNIPPVYGKVFVSVQPRDSDILSVSEKDSILNNILIPKSSVSITPEIVDPEFLFIILDIGFNYDPTRTNLSNKQLETKIINAIENYANDTLNRFDAVFRYSQFLNRLDSSDDAILNTFADVFIQKRFTPDLIREKTYTLDFINILYDSSAGIGTNRTIINESSRFKIDGVDNCTLKDFKNTNDTTKRVIHAVTGSGVFETIVKRDVGYIQGSRIVLDNFKPESFFGLSIQIDVIPENFDIVSNKNNILTISYDSRKFNIVGKTDSTI